MIRRSQRHLLSPRECLRLPSMYLKLLLTMRQFLSKRHKSKVHAIRTRSSRWPLSLEHSASFIVDLQVCSATVSCAGFGAWFPPVGNEGHLTSSLPSP